MLNDSWTEYQLQKNFRLEFYWERIMVWTDGSSITSLPLAIRAAHRYLKSCLERQKKWGGEMQANTMRIIDVNTRQIVWTDIELLNNPIPKIPRNKKLNLEN